MSYALFGNKQIGLKQETQSGVQETELGPECYGLQVTEITAAVEPEVIEQEAFKGSLSASPARIGKIPANVSLAGELKNSGETGKPPKIDAVLQAARFARRNVFCIGISGETGLDKLITGKTVIKSSTENVKGLVVGIDTENHKLYYAAISGNFAVDEIHSLDSQFTAQIISEPVSAGYLYNPSSGENSEGTYTLSVSDGGLKKEIYGAACTFTMETSASSYPSWTAAFTGIANKSTWGSKAGTAPEGIEWENHLPAIVVESNIKIGTDYAPITQSIQIDLGNEVTLIEDQNSPTWFKHALVVKRAGTATVNLSVADLEQSGGLYQKLFMGEIAAMSFKIGEGAGNQINVLLPAVQYTGISESDNNSLLAQALTLKLTGEDDEILLWFR